MFYHHVQIVQSLLDQNLVDEVPCIFEHFGPEFLLHLQVILPLNSVPIDAEVFISLPPSSSSICLMASSMLWILMNLTLIYLLCTFFLLLLIDITCLLADGSGLDLSIWSSLSLLFIILIITNSFLSHVVYSHYRIGRSGCFSGSVLQSPWSLLLITRKSCCFDSASAISWSLDRDSYHLGHLSGFYLWDLAAQEHFCFNCISCSQT